MKRKVKFQEGGEVEAPARRPAPRSKFSRMSAAARARRAATQAEIAQQDMEIEERARRGEFDAETRRRLATQPMPSGRQDFTTDPQGTTRRGAATGREMVPFQEPGVPARPSASRALAEVGTPRPTSLGSPRPRVGGNLATLGGALAMEAAEPLVNYGRRNAERYAAEADARREANLQAFRNRELNQPAEGPTAGSMQTAPAPRPATVSRNRPAAVPFRELSADRLNELAMGAEPRNAEERIAQMRIVQRLREMVEAPPRMEQPAPAQAPARMESMGGSGNIGAASARERGEQVGPPGEYNNFKRGGMVKPKAKAMKTGGKVPAPKKMMKGGIVAKPKSKAKPMAKPMPFKKGGVIKKGRK